MKKAQMFINMLLVASLGLLGAQTSMADMKASDKIKYRQSGYTFMRWNMGIIKNNVIKHPQKYNKEKVIAAAKVISAISESGIETLFSDDTQNGKGWKATRAKAKLFSHPVELKQYADEFRLEAKSLVAASHSGDVGLIKTHFKSLLSSCKACHKDFRAK